MVNKIRSVLIAMFLPLLTIGILILVFFRYTPSQAASRTTFVVNTTADTSPGPCDLADCTLREAILAANNSPGADIITFSLPPSATITLSGTVLPFITDQLTIDGSTAVNLTVSGDDASRVFVIDSIPFDYLGPDESYDQNEIGAGTTVTLTNLTIISGSAPGGYGGGIFNSGTLLINNSVVGHSTSTYGAGAIHNNGYLTITDSVVCYNTSGAYGGALFSGDIFGGNLAQTTILNSSFLSNTSAGESGGAIVNVFGVLTVKNSTFSHNASHDIRNGGAIFNADTLIVEDSTFTNNMAGTGGAISNDSSGTMSILNSTFYSNTASGGGGAFDNFHIATVVNSTFSGNSASFAGAIWNRFNRPMTVTNSTFTGNLAPNDGGGIYNQGVLDIRNTIIANSISGSDCYSQIPLNTSINNLIEDGSCNPLYSGDPNLGPLQNNGGPTHTCALLVDSPAIDTGSNAVCPATDQRGVIRPLDGDGDGLSTCDIGAFELEEAYIVGLAAENDGPTELGQATNFTATVAAGTNVNYTWDFGDGSSVEGPIVSHTYDEVGVYTATVTATNLVSSESATTSVTVDQTVNTVFLPVAMKP